VIVVSNSSPLISLGAIGRLELLHKLFGQISIPLAVQQEVRSVEISTERWVVPRQVDNPLLPQALGSELDWGEAEAIALAVELGADLLLMDERRGRRLASRFGLKVLGVLGILVDSKRTGLIEKIEPVLVELREKAGFRISTALYERALQEAGEAK
jgi:predicted nucleic acid-binding protein